MQINDSTKTTSLLTRRSFLKGIAATSAIMTMKPSLVLASHPARSLSFDNLHTGERLKVTYYENGGYIHGALHEINHILRDYRNNQSKPIDPALLDKLVVLQRNLESRSSFQIISGYRSPQTNHMLHEHTSGVASKSQHLLGKAVDVRLPDRQLADLHRAALRLNNGGVGYYPQSDFVHIDTGPARSWG